MLTFKRLFLVTPLASLMTSFGTLGLAPAATLAAAVSFSFFSPLPAAGSSFEGIIPEKLHDAKGKRADSSVLEGKFIGLYFTASWCAPCRAFTPSLIEFQESHSEHGFEVVMVSMDRSNTDKTNYMRKSKIPWLNIPGAGGRKIKQLADRFQVQGIPALVILSPDGQVVTTDGREDVMFDPETAFEKWKTLRQS